MSDNYQERHDKLVLLYRAKGKVFKEDWIETTIKLTLNVSLENFFYAIDYAINSKGFKFDDLIPFIKEKGMERRLTTHNELKQESIADAIKCSEGSSKLYLRLLAKTFKQKYWPKGMTAKIFHDGIAQKFEICQNEQQRIKTLEEADQMFEDMKRYEEERMK